MNERHVIDSWDELLASLDSAVQHPMQTAWDIYYYLQDNYKEAGSQQVRTLLALYMKIPVVRPSIIHSRMLGMAVKISEEYDDFRFPQFLQMWGYDDKLMSYDRRQQPGKDGRLYLSLKERVDRRLKSYTLHHQNAGEYAVDGIMTMYAVKVSENSKNGRRRYFVKLVAADGLEIVADSHPFPCKPWEIQGRLYDVSVRNSKQGNKRVEEVVFSQKRVGDVFPVIVGYVDKIDEKHGHYHIYDQQSRHFVAEKPGMEIKVGDFVEFAPIVPAIDKFKSAAVQKVISHDDGIVAFGTYSAVVSYVNLKDGYLRYRITSPIADTPEGKVSPEGFASLTNVCDDTSLHTMSVGDEINLLLFLKRGKDGMKRNHVVEICQKKKNHVDTVVR